MSLIRVMLTSQEIEHLKVLLSSIVEIATEDGYCYTLTGEFDDAISDGRVSVDVYEQIEETLSNNTSRCIIANPPHDNYNYDEFRFHPPVMIVEDICLKAGDVVSFLRKIEPVPQEQDYLPRKSEIHGGDQ